MKLQQNEELSLQQALDAMNKGLGDLNAQIAETKKQSDSMAPPTNNVDGMSFGDKMQKFAANNQGILGSDAEDVAQLGQIVDLAGKLFGKKDASSKSSNSSSSMLDILSLL